MHSGDEPHYLVLLNSIIGDGDLDVGDDYAAVHAGAPVAGHSFRGQPLDHHVSWYRGDDLVYWNEAYHADANQWGRDEHGNPVARLRDGVAPSSVPRHEYSQHPLGLPATLALFLFPLRNTEALEPAALICTALTVVAGMWLFEALVAPYAPDGRLRLSVTAIAFLGTPAWHYGRTLFAEPYLMTLAVAAYTAALRFDRHLVAGSAIGLAVLMKPPAVLLAGPLALAALRSRGFGGVVRLAAPVAAAAALLLGGNLNMHGGMFRSTLEWSTGHPVEGAVGLLLSPEHGLIPFAPAALLALVAWPQFLRDHRADGAVLLAAFASYFGLMALWGGWWGGHCYGPRLIVPVVPFLFVSLCSLPNAVWFRDRDARRAAAFVAAVSILFGGVGAFGCGWSWSTHPLTLLHGVVVGA